MLLNLGTQPLLNLTEDLAISVIFLNEKLESIRNNLSSYRGEFHA